MPKSSNNIFELDHRPNLMPTTHAAKDALGRILRRPAHHRPDTQCDGFECENIVEAGLVLGQQRRAFCSNECRASFHSHQHYCGDCEYCGKAFYTSIDRVGISTCCSREHYFLRQTDLLYIPTGPFRELIETYIATVGHYRGKTITAVKVALVGFFGYVHTVEGVTELNAIKPSMVTRFNAAERLRGITTTNSISFVSMFFKLKMAEDDVLIERNPVIPNIHNQKRNIRPPRPYKDEDLKFIWDIVEQHNRISLMLAFAIGKECGLRVGEVCNIRLQDVDQDKQTIFVRLPTKNMNVRTVPYHDDVAALLPRWLEQRDPDCKHDGLLHSVKLAMFNNSTLDRQYRELFSGCSAPAFGFSFHRLRHSWATRLMNNGMELAVLMQLGGWTSWDSMRRYIQVLASTIKAQYEDAYRKLEVQRVTPAEPALSLADFAMLATLDVPPALPVTA